MEDYMNDKTKQISIRMTIEDFQSLEKQRNLLGMSQVKFISHIINNGINEIVEVSSPRLKEDMEKIERILNQIGNNLNQIAAALNSGEYPNIKVDKTFEYLDKNLGVLLGRLNELKKEKITFTGNV